MKGRIRIWKASVAVVLSLNGCGEPNIEKNPGEMIYKIPLVVHVLHKGEPVGFGPNLSDEHIIRQIEILNEDFRRKTGTRGFNNHPDGADTRMEFVLARRDPDGEPTNGIIRIDTTQFDFDDVGYSPNYFAKFSYWPPNQYINIWIAPLPADLACIVLGLATGPETDLPGTELLSLPRDGDAEGIIINWVHFGESDMDCHARFGRTLTHEMGHYFGLLHTWGGRDCQNNDYCDDTPAVDNVVVGRTPFTGCLGELVMISNYMNYTDDEVMNVFTNDQVARMHYVLAHHPGRKALLGSPGLRAP